MSCYRIEYRDGKKVMIPVGSREEYLQLRGSRRQKELLKAARGGDDKAKRQLMQFNYSCIPGDDGMLKGCTQMSDTIGMDIDHIEPKLMAEVALHILSMKDELGLMMLEKSARGEGYHLVMKRKTYMSQEENLQWASKKLGVEYDKGAKDITRVFFATTEEEGELIFLDPQLFTAPFLPSGHPFPQGGKESDSNDAIVETPHKESAVAKGTVAKGTVAKGTATEGTVAEGGDGIGAVSLPYSTIIPTFFKMETAAFPEVPEGTRNDTIFNVVAKYLRYCTDHSFGKIKALIYPEYSFGLPEAEVDAIITSALSRERSLTPKVVKEVLAKNRSNSSLQVTDGDVGAGTGGVTDEDDDLSYSPPAPPHRLTRLHQLLVKNFDGRFTPMVLQCSVPELAAHAAHYRGEYINGNEIGAQDFVDVIGGSGSGKGTATALHNLMVKSTLQASDFLEFEKLRINNEEREKKANAKDKPSKYHPRLHLFETTSVSSILELQTNLGENGMLLGHFSEADSFCRGGGATIKQLTSMFRKAWSGEVQTQFYLSDTTCNTMVRMCCSLVVCGTYKSVLNGVFGGDNTENGFMQRFMHVVLPRRKRTFRPPVGNRLTKEEYDELQEMLVKLFTQDLALDKQTLMLDMPLTRRLIYKWYDDLEERYNNGEITEAEADLSARVGEHIMKAAIPLVALEGKETKEILDFARWIGDVTFYNLCWIFGHKVQETIKETDEMMGSHHDLRKTAEPILALLPEVFSIKQMQDARQAMGQSQNCKSLLSRYCKNGKIVRVDRGMYRKVKKGA